MDFVDYRIIASVAAFGTLGYLAYNRAKPQIIPGIPHNPMTSWRGDLPAQMKSMKETGSIFEAESFLSVAAKALGSVYQMCFGPFVTAVVVVDAQEYEDLMLRERSKFFQQSDMVIASFSALMAYSLIGLKTNDMWKRHKRIATQLMGTKYLRTMTPAIVENANHLIDLWHEKARVSYSNGACCFSCKDDFDYAIMDTVSAMIAERSTEALLPAIEEVKHTVPRQGSAGGAVFTYTKNELITSMYWLAGSCGGTLMPIWLTPVADFLQQCRPKWRGHYKRLVAYLDSCIEERRAAKREARALGIDLPPAKSFVGMVVEREDIPGQETLSDREIRDECIGFMFAGKDTTATTLEWCMKYLAEAPEVQKTLRAELLAVLGDSLATRNITFEDVNSGKTPYLEAVLAETLRCARVIEASNRCTTAPVTILGRTVPANTQVLFPINMATNEVTDANFDKLRARDSVRSESSLKAGLGGRGLWNAEDIHKFNPSRWLKTDENGNTYFDSKSGFNFAFGLGTRSCAGKQLALLSLKIYIATINLNFFMDSVPEVLASHLPRSINLRYPRFAYVAPKPWDDA